MVKESKRIFVFAFIVLLAAIWLILFENMWDLAARLLLVAAIVPAVWALLKKESNKLDLTITLLALFGIAWLIWVENVSLLYGVPLLAFALIAVKWTVRGQAQANRLLGFFVKTFALFLIGTGIAYFIFFLGFAAPNTYYVYPIHAIVEIGMIFIFPISLLLEAISIIIYGIFRIKLKPWEIFLSSFYVTAFVVFTIGIWMPRTPTSNYSSTASAIGAALGFLFLSLFIAGITASVLTVVYAILKEP